MSYIPNCRTDENYNEKYLKDFDAEFVKGFDWAVEQALNLFNNLEVYPELDELLTDNKAIIVEGKSDIVKNAVEHWFEMERNELITSMLDSMGEEEYERIKAEIDENEKVKEESND